MTEDEKARHDSEYKELVALYIELLHSLGSDNEESALMMLSQTRFEQAFGYVLDGLDIDYDEAIALLKSKNDNGLTKEDIEIRKRLIAAIDNLVDFSVCEEYQLYDETIETLGGEEIDFDSDEYEELLVLCGKYNDSYAAIENSDIRYAGMMAALWSKLSVSDYLVYWTQNDAKVRPWHMALQGYAASVDEFPSWMIPPIEYNCRCFLEPLEVSSLAGKINLIKNSTRKVKKPKQLDDVYSESLAKCGRIFGKSHSYFKVKKADKPMLERISSAIKEQYYE